MRRFLKKVMIVLLALAALLYVAFAGLTWFYQDHILYTRAYSESMERPELHGSGVWLEQALLERADAAFYETPGATRLVVYLHGNGECVGDVREAVEFWQRRGYHVLLPEYRGFCQSAGEPGQEVITQDVLAWIEHVERTYEGIDGFVLHGYSLGGAVAASVARRRSPRAMVLRSTFSSVVSMAHRRWLPGGLARDAYDTLEVVQGAGYPVLVTHGTQDRLIDPEESARIAQVGAHVTHRTYACGHVGCHTEFKAALRGWLDVHGM